jgi:hypothetical protein
MALVFCTRCGHQVSTTAPRCPGCGEARFQSSNPAAQSGSDVPTQALAEADEQQQSVISTDSIETSALLKRYRDAYSVAGVIVGFGRIIKTVGLIVAALAILAGLAAESPIYLLAGLFFAVFIGGIFYLLGVIVSAQGQIFKGSLDTAINTSPFLLNTHRAEIMCLY